MASAWRITRSCDGPLGAVSPLEAPSWLTALPRTTASTRWPLRSASESRSSASMPTPSPQPTPSAPAPKALQRPSGERPRWRAKEISTPGVAITVTPPASASEHSPERSAWHARCSATSDDEQAVSIVTAGPDEPERVGHAPRGDAAGRAGRQVALGVRRRARVEPVVVVHDAGEHAGVRAAQRRGIDARVLEGLPGRLEQQPLLRVGGRRLARAHAEEGRVEAHRRARGSRRRGRTSGRRAPGRGRRGARGPSRGRPGSR